MIKKIKFLYVVFGAVLGIAIILTACGSKKALDTSAEGTLEAFTKDDTAIQELIESLIETGLTVDIIDNTMTCTYTFEESYDSSTISSMAASIEESLSENDSAFESILDELKTDSEISGITLEIVYEDAAGTEIFSKEFK